MAEIAVGGDPPEGEEDECEGEENESGDVEAKAPGAGERFMPDLGEVGAKLLSVTLRCVGQVGSSDLLAEVFF